MGRRGWKRPRSWPSRGGRDLGARCGLGSPSGHTGGRGGDKRARWTARLPAAQDGAHLTVMRAEGSGWSIRGRRALNVFACGIRRPCMVLRTPLRPPGTLRMDLRSSMASEACGKMGCGRLLGFPRLEETGLQPRAEGCARLRGGCEGSRGRRRGRREAPEPHGPSPPVGGSAGWGGGR